MPRYPGARRADRQFILDPDFSIQSTFGQDRPELCHPNKMRLQSGIRNVAGQLQALRGETQTFQLLLSQFVLLSHSVPP